MRGLLRTPFWAGLASVLVIAGCVSTTRIDMSAMSFSEQPLIGKIVWNDLITDDLDAARRFYGELFGWTYEEVDRGNARRYVIARAGEAYVGGMLELTEIPTEKPISRWLPFASVEDVDAAVDRATAAGARIAAPATNVNLGRVAAIIDPQGAVFGLARSRIGDPDDASTAPGPGRIVLTELLANDPQAASQFYAAVVGYEPRITMRRGGEYTWLTHQGAQRVGLFKNPTDRHEPVWLTYFAVDDPAQAAARVQALGGRVLLAPSPQLRDGAMAVATDPTGALFVLQKHSG